MKGLTKAVMRAPHLVGSKVGMSKKSNDPEFDELNRKMATMETAVEKLVKDAKVFSDGVLTLLMAGENWAQHFSVVFHPIAGEYDLIGKHPESADTVRNVTEYQTVMEELRAAVSPEMELIQSRIIAPSKELQTLMKTIRKNITKREHKLVDYDRYNNSLTKLREKKEKTLSDEKNLFKLEQDFEQATADYDFYNTNMKAELPQFMVLATRFIDPLFHSFFYMQLNIFYLMLEKLQAFSSGKYELLGTAAEIGQAYEAARGDAREQIDELSLHKRITSTAQIMNQRQNSVGGSTLGVSRAPSSASTVSRAPSSSFASKKAPPPPPGAASFAAAPPPYSAPAAAAATKRPPPPPPPAVKPRPPAASYVVALYDFDAQADGDLSFRTGDRIEVVQRGVSAEDWWTGKLNGQQGVFPGNYVQDT